jgi:hypothetical protein
MHEKSQARFKGRVEKKEGRTLSSSIVMGSSQISLQGWR